LESFSDLKGNEIRRVAVGYPKNVPVGRYASDVLQYIGIFDEVKDKIMYAGNAKQVLDYVARGEVDAGMVYESDTAARPGETVIAASAPEWNPTDIVYYIAVVKDDINTFEKEFVFFVRSPEVRKILGKYGLRTDY